MKNTDNYPFYRWMPKPLGSLLLFLMFFPVTFSGGAYMCNLAEMAGGLGILNEDVQMASYATTIGMCLFPPFMAGLLTIRRVKHLFLRAFLMLLVMNGVVAVSTNVIITIAACMVIGFFRVMLMMNITFTLVKYAMGIDALSQFVLTTEPSAEDRAKSEHARSWQMAAYYGIMLSIAQCSNLLTSYFAYNDTWRHAYGVVMGMIVVVLLIVKYTMPDEEKVVPYKWEWRKIPVVVSLGAAMTGICYVLVYGKTLDWFSSPRIVIALVLCLVFAAVYLFLTSNFSEPSTMHWEIFGFRNVWLSALLFLVLMILFSSSMFVGTFIKMTTQVGNYDSALLSRWAIVGCLIGTLISLVMSFMRMHFRWILALGFALMAVANAVLYFQYQTEGDYSMMAVIYVIDYAGMIIPYAMLVPLGMKHLPVRYMTTFVFVMLMTRNAIAPVAGMSVYTNALQHQQRNYMERMIQDINVENYQAQQLVAVSRTVGGDAAPLAVWRGVGGEASTIAAMRSITGVTIWILIGCVGVVLLFPYQKHEYA